MSSKPSRPRPSTPPRPQPRRPPTRSPSRANRQAADDRRRLIVIVVAAVVVLLGGAFLIFWLLNRDDEFPVVATLAATPLAQETAPATVAVTQTPTEALTVEPAASATIEAAPAISAAYLPPDIPHLQDLMFQLINETRRDSGLRPMAWDVVATTSGQFHAEEMVEFGFLSHWDLEGFGPDFRYVQQGGLDAVSENVYALDHSPGGEPTTPADWEAFIRQAHDSLMSSQGHRENILRPWHTHVGIGLAYDPATGRLRVAQEFLDRYVTLAALPTQASLGEVVTLQGRLLNNAHTPLLNLAYEPFPQPLSLAELSALETFQSPAETYEVINITPDAEGNFSVSVPLNHERQPGLYHLRLWVNVGDESGPVLVANPIMIMR
jgi:uncharacterized protein YkwD